MKTTGLSLAFLVLITGLFTLNLRAATYYVDANGAAPVSPYSSWSTAATNIQDAVSLAQSGDTVLVTNGVYQYGGYSNARVYVLNGLVTIQSVNGPAVTTIMGYQSADASGDFTCVFLGKNGVLSGFTLTNGAATSGGGTYCATTNCIVTNCVITGNLAIDGGGGAYSGTLINCVLSNNTSAPDGAGGGANGSILINCLLNGNQAGYDGGGAYDCTLINCTVVSNTIYYFGNGNGGGVYSCMAKNCIIYDNPQDNYDYYQVAPLNNFTNCCTYPMPPYGANNITNDPAFVNPVAGDYQLQSDSPCIDAGNNAFVTVNNDLDGNLRITGAAVDLGCYEYQETNVLYVSSSSTNPVAPYTSWLTSATNIQDAVALAQSGDTVDVGAGIYTNGGAMVYGASNRVALTNAISLIGVSGPQNTAIVGNVLGSGVRCVYVGTNAFLTGFSLVDGEAATSGNSITNQSGGGAWCEANGIISNCIFGGTNFPYANGGSPSDGCTALYSGGGDYGGTIYNSVLAGNYLNSSGNGVAAAMANLINCIVTNNGSSGANKFTIYGGTLSNCTIVNNLGVGAYQDVLYNCAIISNVGGGTKDCTNYQCLIFGNFGGGGAVGGILCGCILANNTTLSEGGGAYMSTLYNCIAVSNSAPHGGGVALCTSYNSIVYDNSISGDYPTETNYYGSYFYYCDTTPYATGPGNITNDPAFVNPVAGDYELASNSPCINSGDNLYVSTTNDLTGNSRISGDTVDMGAYEYQNPSSILSYAWAQEYGLPVDGSVDYSDLDGTGMPNWEKSIAELDPTNAASVLAMSPPAATNNATGIVITWQSVTNIDYILQRSSDLTMPFSSIQSNLVGQVETTSYTDATATNSVPYFYRIGVQ